MNGRRGDDEKMHMLHTKKEQLHTEMSSPYNNQMKSKKTHDAE
jgi:hypothetical protein